MERVAVRHEIGPAAGSIGGVEGQLRVSPPPLLHAQLLAPPWLGGAQSIGRPAKGIVRPVLYDQVVEARLGWDELGVPSSAAERALSKLLALDFIGVTTTPADMARSMQLLSHTLATAFGGRGSDAHPTRTAVARLPWGAPGKKKGKPAKGKPVSDRRDSSRPPADSGAPSDGGMHLRYYAPVRK